MTPGQLWLSGTSMNRGAISNLVIGATIALLPFFNRFTIYDFSRTSKDNLFLIICIVLSFLMGALQRRLTTPIKVVLGYFFVCLALNHHNLMSVNVMMYSFYTAAGLSLFVNAYERLDLKTERYILNGMMVGAIFQSILCYFDYFGVSAYVRLITAFVPGLYGSALIGEVMGSLGNSNLVGSYLVLTSMAFLITRRFWLFILPAIAAIATGSHMAIASLVAGVLYFLLKKKVGEKLPFFLSLCLMVTFYFTGLAGRDSTRFGAWRDIFSRMTQKDLWVFGGGPGWLPDQKIFNYAGEVMVQEHGEIVALLDTFGLVGAALLVFAFVSKKGTFGKWSPVLFVGFINSYGHFNLHQSTTAIIILIAIALCLSEGENNVI